VTNYKLNIPTKKRQEGIIPNTRLLVWVVAVCTFWPEEKRKGKVMMMEARCKVCVTGASGYVASLLINKLLAKGYTVHATLRDLSILLFHMHLFCVVIFIYNLLPPPTNI